LSGGDGWPGRLELYVDGFSRANSTATQTKTSNLFGIYRCGWSFSTNQDLNGDIALIACFAASWTPAMVRRCTPIRSASCAHGARSLRSWAVRHPQRPLDRHQRGHLPHGVAPHTDFS
jgi:hypothetical protein